MSTNNPAESSWISHLSDALSTLSHESTTASLESSVVDCIYGSNRIETAGTTYPITAELCHSIFHHPPDPANQVSSDPQTRIPPHHRDAIIADLALTGRKPADLDRAHKEVIQHAQAFVHLANHIILRNQPCTSGDHSAEENDEIGAGKYRTHEVAVKYDLKAGGKPKTTLCMRAKAVPRYMREFVDMLNKDCVGQRAVGGPYQLAARYHHQFVFIHPFGDGNGRMGRLVLNVLLLKYLGEKPLWGEKEEELEEGTWREDERMHAMEKRAQKEYIDMVSRASRVFHEEDMEVEPEHQTWHKELTSLLKRLFEKS
ncbi:fido domain-containing protein [Cercophora samala]|uniref:Fido domain-containing protein n=1 Tax=Cercophora samala TaxID=330535 RepID=A0AA39Z7C5_9PEZI|nr:fido domain-containing protein [Cercophora samala]